MLFLGGDALLPGVTLTFTNPGVTAAIAALVTIPVMLIVGATISGNRRRCAERL